MATIIQKPDTLSLSRNLKELIISTSSEISLQLLKGDSMLLEETYLPDVNNRVHVDLADIVTSTLSLTMPSGDAVSTSQSSVYSDFTVKVDGTSVAEFTAVRSGVERFSDTAANFLTANWLTWQPQVKEVLHDQPEWLTYYPASGSCACYARFYYTDGTSGEKKVCDVSQCVSINTRFSKLWALDESGKERYGVIDVYIKDAQGLRLTYVQRYVLCSQGALDEVYLCENSLGGLDTFRFSGDRKLVPEIGYTSLLLDNSYTAADPDLSRKWSQNTGMLTGRECEWCWELFRSSAAYHLYRGTILPIVLDASSVEKSAMSVLAAYSFDYRYASDLGLLNVVRSENLPEVVEVSGPDAEVFFLTPRLNEFPSAVLSDDLIIPVQSPYEESWYTLSVGGLKSALLSSVETIYGPMWHVHDNLQVLNLLSVDEKGNLLYNGLAVGSGIVGAHDHHGETIRPSVLVIPTTAPSVDSDLRPGEYAMYLDSSSAVDGETPTKAGLDEEELWAILSGNAGTEVVAKQHLPSDTVYSEDLDDYIKISDLNTLDFVTLSTDQIITGRKTFANDVIFGAAKEDGSYSRLLIPSTSGPGIYDLYVSTEPVDGEVPSASGGIDEDELWTILGTSGTQQIDPSHIPVIPVEKVSGLSTALSSYATKEWVEGKDYLTSVSLSTISDLHASWDALLQSAPDFYSKNSVYSKSEADGRFVGIANEQTVTGRKTFSALLTASAGISGTNADLSGYVSAAKLYLPYSGGNKVYDICISTQPIDGEAPSEGGGINEEVLKDYVKKAGDTMTGRLILNKGITITGSESNNITSVRNDTGSITTNRPNSLAAINNALSFKWYNTDWQIGNIRSDGAGSMGFGITSGNSNLVFRVDTSGGWLNGKTIWHSGNDGSGSGLDADLLDGYQASSFLLKSGGTMTGTLTVPSLYVNSVAHIYESASHATRLTLNWTSGIARIYAINDSGSGYYDMSLGQTPGNNCALYFDASAARWGIGTTSPAYKLDVAGEIRATSGITIGSTDDYGWYNHNSRITAGIGIARGVNVGSLLVSSAWADYTKVPTNGIYSKGDIITGGRLFIPSSEGNDKYYIRIE